jgi:hypothetical protein
VSSCCRTFVVGPPGGVWKTAGAGSWPIKAKRSDTWAQQAASPPSAPRRESACDRGRGRKGWSCAAWQAYSARLASVMLPAHAPAPPGCLSSGSHRWPPVSRGRGGQPGNFDSDLAAQFAGCGMQRQLLHGGPQVQLVSTGVAHEAVVGVFPQIRRERAAAGRVGTVHRTGAPEFVTPAAHRGELHEFQHPFHRNAGTQQAIVDSWHR